MIGNSVRIQDIAAMVLAVGTMSNVPFSVDVLVISEAEPTELTAAFPTLYMISMLTHKQ